MGNRSALEGKTEEGWGRTERQKISIFVCVPAVSSPLVFLLPLPKFLVAGLSFPRGCSGRGWKWKGNRFSICVTHLDGRGGRVSGYMGENEEEEEEGGREAQLI